MLLRQQLLKSPSRTAVWAPHDFIPEICRVFGANQVSCNFSCVRGRFTKRHRIETRATGWLQPTIAPFSRSPPSTVITW